MTDQHRATVVVMNGDNPPAGILPDALVGVVALIAATGDLFARRCHQRVVKVATMGTHYRGGLGAIRGRFFLTHAASTDSSRRSSAVGIKTLRPMRMHGMSPVLMPS